MEPTSLKRGEGLVAGFPREVGGEGEGVRGGEEVVEGGVNEVINRDVVDV